ncbi:RdgB/HAM1 family non-canonical purine NTP pyrophosphatase [Planctomonas psychrotolerans]|uniref:RdgB/HAM1 family non-canonical purine NTP pyrophosphatase n=1 Tax=Planctomonas psychrotolerans TaxID=2528712 RepID=UPI0012389DE3|nr:RdgB/HAM1 family non-canonical purine NTP pyrophosphatase [Planctomonas psychrotolerans]
MTRLVLATHNPHKVEELRRILGGRLGDAELVGYDGPEPAETGTTFAENALIKARAAAAHTGMTAIADDSGIGVRVMGGAPGIFSARWSGPGREATDNLALLLWQLTDIPAEHRAASFTCAAAFVDPADGYEHVETAEWTGRILAEPSGAGGFGYDPIFAPDGVPGSAADLTTEEKDRLSHRAMAFDRLWAAVRTRLA